MKTLNEVAKAAQNGNTTALEDLTTKMLPYAHRMAVKYFHKTHPNDIEDYAQEMILHLLSKLSQWRGDALFTTWAHRLFINRCLMSLRAIDKGDRTHNRCATIIEEWPEDITGTNFHVAVSNRNDHAAMDACMDIQKLAANLTPLQYETVYMRFIEGLETPEIVRITGKTKAAIKTPAFHGVHNMAKAAGLEKARKSA